MRAGVRVADGAGMPVVGLLVGVAVAVGRTIMALAGGVEVVAGSTAGQMRKGTGVLAWVGAMSPEAGLGAGFTERAARASTARTSQRRRGKILRNIWRIVGYGPRIGD